jgi:hypothetical protein
MAVRLSGLCAGCPLPPRRFLVLISVRGWVNPRCHSASGKVRSIEKSNDLIGLRTHDLPACSIVPQPTTLPRALRLYMSISVKQYWKDFQHIWLLKHNYTSRNTLNKTTICIWNKVVTTYFVSSTTSYLRLGHPSSLFLSRLPTKYFIHVSSLPCLLYGKPVSISTISQP